MSPVAAPTGLAACNVGGITTYQLYSLPVEHDSKTAEYWTLSKESVKMLRQQLQHVKVFIIDEVSMVSSLNLAYIHLRLEEIFGGDSWFAGKAMIFVGDILQLPPVNDTPVFSNVPSKVMALRVGCMYSVNIWKETVIYDELTINERQKEDKEYSVLLDGIRRGFPSEEAITQLRARVFSEPVIDKYNQLASEGKAPICLIPTRKQCDELNTQLLATLDSETVQLPCVDVIDEGAASTKWNKRAAERLKQINRDSNLTAGLEALLHLANGCRVMLRRNLSTEDGLVNGAIGTVLSVSSTSACVIVKFDNIEDPVSIRRVKNRFCVLKQFYVHRQQFPLTVSYAVTIHKSQGLSLDSAIIDLSDKVFGEGMAYVALSRVRSFSGVHLTAFSPTSIMASRSCVEEVKRLRQEFRPDLPQYKLPAGKTKRKLAGALVPILPKKPRREPSKRQQKVPKKSSKPASKPTQSERGTKRKASGLNEPPSKKPRETPKPQPKPDSGKRDDQPPESSQRVYILGAHANRHRHYYQLDVDGQKRACELLNLMYRRPSGVTPGGPDVLLTSPNMPTLMNTEPDGNCMFRAFSMILTGTQRQHNFVRSQIDAYLKAHADLFLRNLGCFDSAVYKTMEEYLTTRDRDYAGWGSQAELYAMALMLNRCVYTFCEGRATIRGWLCHCPSHVNRDIDPPDHEQGLYLYHTGNHYMVVRSVT